LAVQILQYSHDAGTLLRAPVLFVTYFLRTGIRAPSLLLGWKSIGLIVAVVVLIWAVNKERLAVYLLPAIIANGRRRAMSIYFLNLLLGWTIIGWIIALIWAIKIREDERKRVQVRPSPLDP